MANIHYSNSGGVGPQGPVGPQGDSGASAEVTYAVQGGTSLVQPTFTGSPLFSASYLLTGELVHFRINVIMTNITNFGTGQFYMTLPFNVKYDYYFRNGHLSDASTSNKYSISGHAPAGGNTIWLSTTAGSGQEAGFTHQVPVTLNPADDFHISGSYIRA